MDEVEGTLEPISILKILLHFLANDGLRRRLQHPPRDLADHITSGSVLNIGLECHNNPLAQAGLDG